MDPQDKCERPGCTRPGMLRTIAADAKRHRSWEGRLCEKCWNEVKTPSGFKLPTPEWFRDLLSARV